MELYGDQQQVEWAPETGLEESMRRLNSRDREVYPERPGLPDCAYYMRTGTCGYGAKCRYNHPREYGSSLGVGEYPERVGQPACQYYLRTGTCKFGASCKFHHPKNAGGSLTNAPLNIYGYPLRPGEKECSYYLKTGQCKFGRTCKYDHPQPAGASMPATARPFYPTVQSLSSLSHEQYDNSATNYRVARPPLLPVAGAYGPVVLHPGVVPIPNWNPYSGPVSPAQSPGAQPSVGAASLYGTSQVGSSAPAFAGAYPQLPVSGAMGSIKQQFPERPGQPDCKYYMKTGDCKYGSSCRYNHPPDWLIMESNCALSPLGLSLRPLFTRSLMNRGSRPALFICRKDTANLDVRANSIIQWLLENIFQLHLIQKCQDEYIVGAKLERGKTFAQRSGKAIGGSIDLMFSHCFCFTFQHPTSKLAFNYKSKQNKRWSSPPFHLILNVIYLPDFKPCFSISRCSRKLVERGVASFGRNRQGPMDCAVVGL
ncbi:Zinc finger CCCH domain-containing protein 32 [Sesamum alatum]|uniref:Zinc finger CCCH domain-containing protein 32 n=1 Tax=Sesamum alatum TaxID=300844 RepID=A0AAE1Z4F4_9LAMI|nr:Zinc finger CCCH domain-containing protein 32 [Sesamum alatum]